MTSKAASRWMPSFRSSDAWALDRIDSFENKYLVRNPYYWKVDTAGNQLPYYDEQMKMFVSDPNAIELKAMAGEFLHLRSLPADGEHAALPRE